MAWSPWGSNKLATNVWIPFDILMLLLNSKVNHLRQESTRRFDLSARIGQSEKHLVTMYQRGPGPTSPKLLPFNLLSNYADGHSSLASGDTASRYKRRRRCLWRRTQTCAITVTRRGVGTIIKITWLLWKWDSSNKMNTKPSANLLVLCLLAGVLSYLWNPGEVDSSPERLRLGEMEELHSGKPSRPLKKEKATLITLSDSPVKCYSSHTAALSLISCCCEF